MKNMKLEGLVLMLSTTFITMEADEINKLYFGEEVIKEIVTIDHKKFEIYYSKPEFNLKDRKVKISNGSDYLSYASMIEVNHSVESLTKDIHIFNKDKLNIAKDIYSTIKLKGIKYIADPGADFSTIKEGIKLKEERKRNGESDLDILVNNEYIQHSEETIKKGGGDCEDLSILYVSCLISKDIQGALIIFQNHVIGAFEIMEKELSKYNIKKYLKDNNGRFWIPVEMVYIDSMDFEWAMEKGYNNFIKQYPCYRMIMNGASMPLIFDKQIISKDLY